jgi:hypothetical protein
MEHFACWIGAALEKTLILVSIKEKSNHRYAILHLMAIWVL